MRSPIVLWLIFTVLLLGLGPFTNYSPAGFLDPWIPTGYFLNFYDLHERFGYPYYVSRLPYILVGLSIYSILTPILANFILNVLSLWSACLGVFFSTRASVGVGAAAVATVAFATNSYTMSAMTWDYPDGAAIAFLLLGFWFALAPPCSIRDTWRWIYVGCFWGMAGAVMLIAGLVILPGCMLVLAEARRDIREWGRLSLLIGVGVGIIFVIFGTLSQILFGKFWFLGLQIDQFIFSISTPGLLAQMWGTGLGWVGNSYRISGLLAIAFSGITSLLLMPGGRKNPKDQTTGLLLVAMFVVTIALFAVVEFGLSAVVLRVFYTSSYLIVPAYLVMAVSLGLILHEIEPRWRGAVILIAAAVTVYLPFSADKIGIFAQNHPAGVWALTAIPSVLILFVYVARTRAPWLKLFVASITSVGVAAVPAI